MNKKNLVENSVFAAGLIGIIILLNILGLSAFKRLDLTRHGQYTLSKASKDAVSGLEDQLSIKAYFSKDLPAPYSTNARYVRDILDEYYNASDGKLSYEFLDPMAEESEKDKEKRKEVRKDIFGRSIREETSMESELRSVGIQPVEIRVNEGDNLEVKRVFMGISLRYGDEQEAIPVVTDTSKLEYDLTTLIRKLTRSKVPVIGLITGKDGLDPRQDLSTVLGLLRQQYELRQLDLEKDAKIPDDVTAIIVTGPKEAFSPDQATAMKDFIEAGHSAAFLLDPVRVDLKTTEYTELHHGLDQMLAAFGIRIKPGLLLDADCAQINVTEQRGFMRVQRPVRYPFLPLVEKPDQDQPLLHGLSSVIFPFTSALEVIPNTPLKSEVLLRSSAKSWIQSLPLDLNPLQRWPASINFDGPHPMVVAVSNSTDSEEKKDAEETAKPWRILVIGTSSVIQNQFMSDSGQAMALNLVDWLVMDNAMFEIRSRGLAEAPLKDISDMRRNLIKYGNIIGVPLIFILLGIIRWRMRERRRRLVASMGGQVS